MKIPFIKTRNLDFCLGQLKSVLDGKKAVVVGCGKAGIEYHLKPYKTAGIEVVALCDLNVDLAQREARGNDIKHWYASLGEALEKHDVDVVSICTQPKTHFELCKKALDAGVHVLLEKPVTMFRRELDDLDSLLKNAKSKLTVVHNKKFYPGIMSAKEFFDSGKLGEVLQIDISWITNVERDPFIPHENHWSHQCIGGRWGEVAPHLLYSAYQFCGEMRLLDVQVRFHDNRWPWLPGDDASVHLESKNGFVNLRFGHSHRRFLKENYTDNLNIFGSKGMLIVYPSSCFMLDTHKKLGVNLLPQKRIRDITQKKYVRDIPSSKTGHDLVVKDFLEHVFLGALSATPWAEAKHVMEHTLGIGEALDRKSGRKRLDPEA